MLRTKTPFTVAVAVAASVSASSLGGAPVTFKASGSFYEGCFDPCVCIVSYISTFDGAMRLQAETLEPNYAKFNVSDVNWHAFDNQLLITGTGTYELFVEFATTNQMKLDLEFSGEKELRHFDSQVIFPKGSFPQISIPISMNNMECYDTMLVLDSQPVFGDITGDAVVNVDDLLEVINRWGECPTQSGCDADIEPEFTGDGAVDVDDLLKVITNWS